MVPIRMMTRRCSFNRSISCSSLTSLTGDNTATNPCLWRWNSPLLMLRYRFPRLDPVPMRHRLLFSTSTNDETIIKIDALTKKQKNVYVSKSLYRQMLRWCQSYHQNGYPPDMIRYFTPIPKIVTLAPHLFPTHEYIKQTFRSSRKLQQEMMDNAPDPRTQRVLACLKQLPNVVQHSSDVIISIRSIKDVQNCIRALYRMDNSTDQPQQQQERIDEIEEYEKSCRQSAFEEIKHLNEISVALAKCQQERQRRLRDELPALEKYDKDGSLSHQILPIGTVVQHNRDRWRGVIVHSSFEHSKRHQTKASSSNVRDDFTSLTLKNYTKTIEDADDGDDEKLGDSPSIVYEVLLDDYDSRSHDSDGEELASSSSSSSFIMKQHLLQPIHIAEQSFVTVRQPVSLLQNASNTNTTLLCTLEVVHDQHLCRINNEFIRRIFTKYDSSTLTYVPNTYMNYTYPTISGKCDDKPDTTVATSENDEPDSRTTMLMSDMKGKVQDFAFYLVSIIDDMVGGGPNDTSSNRTHPNQSNHQLMDVFADIRNDLYGMATIDTVIARYDEQPLSTQLATQLRGMELIARTVMDAIYCRRLSRATASMKSINERSDKAHQHRDKETSSKFTPKFHLGQIVRHKKYNFRGVVTGRDIEPVYNVSKWDGLRDIPNAKELPFYNIIPDQQDCIEIFGGERPLRYVCEANLEPCPSDQMFLDVDVDVGWMKLSDGSYRPPPLELFKYGYDMDDNDCSEKCFERLESAINQWHYECVRNNLLPEPESSSDGESLTVVRNFAIPIRDMIELLKVADDSYDTPIRDAIKFFKKAHPNIQFRTKLQYGLDLIMADNCEEANIVFRSIVTDDPTYIEAWNYLSNSEHFLSLQRMKNDALYEQWISLAMASAHQVLQLNENDLCALSQLGMLHFQKEEYTKAEAYFRKRLDLDPWAIVSSKLSQCIDLGKEQEEPERNEHSNLK